MICQTFTSPVPPWIIRYPLMVAVESSQESMKSVTSVPPLVRRSMKIEVTDAMVALLYRKIPLPGSASVIVVEKV